MHHQTFGGHVSPNGCLRHAALTQVSPGTCGRSDRLCASQVTAVCWWEILSHLSSSLSRSRHRGPCRSAHRVLCRDAIGENGDVMTPHHAPFGHDNGAPAGPFTKVGPDLVALEDAGRIGEDHDGVGRSRCPRVVGTTGPEVFPPCPRERPVREAIACRTCVPHVPVCPWLWLRRSFA